MPEHVYLLAVERWPEVGPPNFKRADSESLKSQGNSQLELGTPSGRWKKLKLYCWVSGYAHLLLLFGSAVKIAPPRSNTVKIILSSRTHFSFNLSTLLDLL